MLVVLCLCLYVDAYINPSENFFVLSFVLPCAYAYVASVEPKF